MHTKAHPHSHLFGVNLNPAKVTLAALLTLLFLIFLIPLMNIIAVPGQAQNSAPPTARQAAAMPQFASRLAHPAHAWSPQMASRVPYPERPRASYKNPQDLRALSHRGVPLDNNDLYDNGPINGTTDAWTINSGFVISDTLTVPNGGGSVNGLNFGAWVFQGDVLQSVQVSITSSEFGGTTYFNAVVNFTQSGCFTNQYGFNVCTESSTDSFGSVNLAAGTYWVNLANAVVNTGDPIYWDENSGIGCESQGCPSAASETGIGTIPSEAFTILGGATTSCEFNCPPECVHDEGSFNVIHNFTASEQSPAPGLAIDQAGRLYGATASGGNNGEGLAYRLASIAENWIFNPLYSFLGGNTGQNPLPGIVGPENLIYGTADGGLPNCASNGNNNYCGVVYMLRPPPTACLTSLCSWKETVIYQFMGAPDGARPNGNIVFDKAGNLYGTTYEGGAYGVGAVYELTPSQGGWTEKVIHSFTGGNDGGLPASLLVGQDGNLYGTTAGGGGGGGVIFQLVPSGGSWTENLLASFSGCVQSGSGGSCSPVLVQETSGNFYGLNDYTEQFNHPPFGDFWWGFGQIFMMSPSGSGWQFTVLDDTYYLCSPPAQCYGYDEGDITFHGLAIDGAGNLYGDWGWDEGGNYYVGAVFKLLQPYQEQDLAGFAGDDFRDVEVGPTGNLYGTTGACNGTYGTVWQLTP